MKLTEVQRYALECALQHQRPVLQELRQKTLRGKALEVMKALESSVQSIETVLALTATGG